MFVVCVWPHALRFSVVRRSTYDHRDFTLRLESVLAKEMALVCTQTAHLNRGCHQRSACHFAVLVDNDVQGHSESSGRETAIIVTEETLSDGVSFA